EKCVHHVPKHPFTMSAIYTGRAGVGVGCSARSSVKAQERGNFTPSERAFAEDALQRAAMHAQPAGGLRDIGVAPAEYASSGRGLPCSGGGGGEGVQWFSGFSSAASTLEAAAIRQAGKEFLSIAPSDCQSPRRSHHNPEADA